MHRAAAGGSWCGTGWLPCTHGRNKERTPCHAIPCNPSPLTLALLQPHRDGLGAVLQQKAFKAAHTMGCRAGLQSRGLAPHAPLPHIDAVQPASRAQRPSPVYLLPRTAAHLQPPGLVHRLYALQPVTFGASTKPAPAGPQPSRWHAAQQAAGESTPSRVATCG